tara:strand:- start:10178 stop:10495 length:318 start_codon:yes stop_codon:yes gene_type:complete
MDDQADTHASTMPASAAGAPAALRGAQWSRGAHNRLVLVPDWLKLVIAPGCKGATAIRGAVSAAWDGWWRRWAMSSRLIASIAGGKRSSQRSASHVSSVTPSWRQ